MRSKAPEDPASVELDVEETGKYRALLELGRGGTAVVSAAIARGIGGFTKLVVLKNIKEEFLSDRETVRMFVNEARLSARMNHPNLVQVYEVYRHVRSPVIVMEYLEGQSLARLQHRAFADPGYSADLSIAILCRVLAGLAYAHGLADYDGTPLEIVHRDVSPHNVMVTYDGQVKLVDFGIAKLSSRGQDTQTGVIKGKIAYMAPEQLEGGEIDRRSDLFAVGVMLWEAIARQRLWGMRSDAEIVRCLVLDQVPRLSAALPDVDPELLRITDRALAVKPDARYASAAEFQADLEAYLDRRGVSVRQEDIGDFVSRVCADVRASTAERLQAELARFATSGPDSEDALASFDALRTPLPEGRQRRWPLLALLALLLASATGLYLWLEIRPVSPTREATQRVIEPPPATPEAEPAAPATVRLSVSVTPSDASVWLDGRRLEQIPSGLAVPRDEREHELRIEAPGHEPASRRLRLDTDTALSVVLAPLPRVVPGESPDENAPPAATKRRGRRPPASPPRSEPAPAPAAGTPAEPAPAPTEPALSCDPPFYIGADGLKRYRRECL